MDQLPVAPVAPVAPVVPTWRDRLRGLWPRRIGWRLALGFGLLVVLMLVALVQASFQIHHITRMTQRFATSDMQRLLRVQALSLQTEGVGSALVRLMHAPRESRVAEYADVDQRNRRIDDLIASFAQEMLDSEQEETLKRLMRCRKLYADAFIATVDEVEANDLKAATRALHEQINPALKAMLQESNTLLQRERYLIETQLVQAQQLYEQLAIGVGGLSLLAVVLAVWLGLATGQSVIVPLVQLEAAARRMARGDYSGRVPTTSAEEVDRVGQALNRMTDAVVQREQHIVRLAYQDVLTGLPNRTALLTPEVAPPRPFNCVVLMDLARLKVINETLGHTTGDTMIKEVARRTAVVLEAAVAAGEISPQTMAARLSGGTFAVALHVTDRAAVQAVHARMEQAMVAPASCGMHSVDLSLIYGCADFGSEGAPLPIETLMRNAEVALHTAKRATQGLAWYNEAQEAARLSYLSLVSDLRVAVATSQLQMWLQPKFSLKTGRAVGAEALVRWQHPQRGFVSPAEFIPFAEQTGYISLVTQWMLEQAVRTLAAWAPSHPELSIAVNMSTRDLADPGFVGRVSHLLALHGVEPRRLRLEVVESGLMDDPQRSVAVLHALRELGCPLSIDDFGTGYSSLSYLQQLPVSELKIDRSFVQDIHKLPGTQRLFRTMVEMGHGMGLMVTAEGVETEAEKEVITRLNCDVVQGYLTSRPLHSAALQTWFDGLPAA